MSSSRTSSRTSTTWSACSTASARTAAPDTRVIINSYSRAWRPMIRAAEIVGAKPRKPIRNWVGAADVRNLLDITGFETITRDAADHVPEARPGLSIVANGLLANIWPLQPPLRHVVGHRSPEARAARGIRVGRRPLPERARERSSADERVPNVGTSTEIVFVEGGSRDGTREEIQAVVDEPHGSRPASSRSREAARETPSATDSPPPTTRS